MDYARELLEGSLGSGIEVLGLFGRMPAAEQARIFAPGERRRVQFKLTPAELGFYNRDLRFVVEPGAFKVFAGTSSTGVRRSRG